MSGNINTISAVVNDDNDEKKQSIRNTGTVASTTATATTIPSTSLSLSSSPSMTVAVFVYWIIPLLFIAIFSRNAADVSEKTIPIEQQQQQPTTSFHRQQRQQAIKPAKKDDTINKKSVVSEKTVINLPDTWPKGYRDIINTIRKRRRQIATFEGAIHTELLNGLSSKSSNNDDDDDDNDDDNNEQNNSQSRKLDKTTTTTTKRTTTRTDDAVRNQFHEKIDNLLQEYNDNPNDIYRAIAVADTMRFYDMQFHDGGTYELQAINMYDKIIDLGLNIRNKLIQYNKPTNRCFNADNVNDELTLEYEHKSIDGLLCAIYTAQGKVYFMANMFERAVQTYDKCLNDIDRNYLDARNARASSLLVLGKYIEAGADYLQVIQRDERNLFIDAYTGIARVLETKEDAVIGGWDSILNSINDMIPIFEHQYEVSMPMKEAAASALNRLHHVLFTYNDVKTKNYSIAFQHLKKSFYYKLSVISPWNNGTEIMKVQQSKSIFRSGFWSTKTGSITRVPIFIIGFVRSGSTFLERILDAHPLIAGTGENSVFNGRLGDIRDQIVQASISGSSNELASVTEKLANEVVDEMRKRWEIVQANTEKDNNNNNNEEEHYEEEKPERLADKMLTNYYNVGFIQMLYPNALILHVAREPMDTLFSAYKHEFPPGSLDYTSDFTGLAELYESYRSIMDHWDDVLPGRITHIRYEDMVNDFDNIARAIINATGLPWHDDVLQFHTKKHAVNTLSSTQVRKGVYKDSLKSWMRYEKELQPLIELIGDRIKYDNMKTTLPGYHNQATSNPETESTTSTI